ncbi:MAG: cell envelope integrity protein CreD [Alphaproteobacteria bacterium]|nr:cell envelope integrity protein CreD [Alphaproteobacteria bacterium]
MGDSDSRPPFFQRLDTQQTAQTVRALLIAAIGLLMAVPLALVEDVIDERKGRRDQVRAEIAHIWGNPQTLTGPLLVIPMERSRTVRTRTDDGRSPWIKSAEEEIVELRHLIILPDDLSVAVTLDHEKRKRSIYESIVYVANSSIAGTFRVPAESELLAGRGDRQILWDQALLVLGIGDTTAIRDIGTATFAGRSLVLEPGTGGVTVVQSGIHARLADLAPGESDYPFAFEFDLNGSASLDVVPTGRESRIALSGDWPHPSFDGDFLPTAREIGETGFSAEWNIPHLARSLPQHWVHDPLSIEAQYRPDRHATGVRLYQPVDPYQQAVRAAKYGLLFVALTLLTFFVMENVTGRRLHLLQYGVVGGALVLFFLLLFSFAEHIGFALAYLVATVAEIAVISVYVGAAMSTKRDAAIVGAILTALYLVLYFVLNAQDYALLAGALTLFVALTATMYATRNLRSRTTSPNIDGLASGRA